MLPIYKSGKWQLASYQTPDLVYASTHKEQKKEFT